MTIERGSHTNKIILKKSKKIIKIYKLHENCGKVKFHGLLPIPSMCEDHSYGTYSHSYQLAKQLSTSKLALK